MFFEKCWSFLLLSLEKTVVWKKKKLSVVQIVVGRGKNGPCEAGALIAVVNDYVFVDKIYSRDASRMGQAGTLRHPLRALGWTAPM